MKLVPRLNSVRRQTLAYHSTSRRISAPDLAPLVLAVILLLGGSVVRAQSNIAADYEPLIGSWEGPLTLGRDEMKLAFTFSATNDQLSAALISAGLGVYGMPADEVILRGRSLTVRISRLDLEFTATLRFDDSGATLQSLDGNWFQAAEMVPVILLPVDQPSY